MLTVFTILCFLCVSSSQQQSFKNDDTSADTSFVTDPSSSIKIPNNSTDTSFSTVPGPPSGIKIQNITESSAHVLWAPPESQTDIIQYEIVANVIHTYSNETLYSPKWTFSNNILRSEIAGLHPATKYNVSIVAVSKSGPSKAAFSIFETNIAEPDQVPPDPSVVKLERTTMVLKLYPCSNNNGPISFYRIIVLNLESQIQIFQEELLQSYNKALNDGLSYYIAADINPEMVGREFVIGDGGRYNGYYNAPLEANTKYRVFVGVVSTLNGLTMVRYPSSLSDRRTFLVNLDEAEGSTAVVFLAIAVAVASVLLIAGVVVLMIVRRRFHRNRRQRLSDNQELCVQGPMIQMANQGYIPDEDLERVNHYDALKHAVWNIPRDCIQVDTMATGDAFFGFGQFGHVVRGTVRKPNDRTPITAACYIVSDGDLTPETKRLMLRKLDILVRAGKHENVASLVGTFETSERVFVVLEHSPLNLKDMLLNHRLMTQTNGKFTSVTEVEMLDILMGIANGMNHLSQKNLMHERLCARNILIFDARIPKVTGHGLSHYNRNNASLDLCRWTAQEVLSGKPPSVKSDVWSFGCLMWEACCVGGTPYSQLNAKRVSYEVCRGVRLPKLPYIGEEFYQLMISCWQGDPGERPTFHEIAQQLSYYKDTLDMYSHINFSITADFCFEPYLPTMEIAEENVCQRSSIKNS